MNLTDFMKHDESPTILVPGIGQMKLSQAKKRVQQMLEELSKRVDDLVLAPSGGDQLRWKAVKVLLDRGVLQAYVDAIAAAQSKQH